MLGPGQQSIARKLTRMNMLVSATALCLACAAFVTYDVATFRQVIVRNLSVQAQVAGTNSVSALMFDDAQAAERTLAAFESAPNVVSACIYTADGKPFASYHREANSTEPGRPLIDGAQEENYWFEAGKVKLVHTIRMQGKLSGYVYIESDLQLIVARLERYLAIALGVLIASLAAAFSVSGVARRSIARPVAKLARTAQTVSQERDYSIRAEEGNAEGELAVLVSAFNEMLSQIEARDRSLQSAHDELEKRVEQRTAELEATNRELESFSYSVSHDLRAPIRSIDGFSQALWEDYHERLDETAKGYIGRVRTAAKNMGQLIDDLLQLSRISRAPLQRKMVNLTDMVRSIIKELETAEAKRTVNWHIEEGMEAFGDGGLLHIVMVNLLGNAWKYTSKHEHARIEFGRKDQDGETIYYVRDDGAGFDSSHAEKLFGAFQRMHGTSEFPGTGIGLATVQRIIHRHGGRIWASAAVEKGATFFFTIQEGTTSMQATEPEDCRVEAVMQ
jgi:signal transduction histidine kinase